MDGWTGLCPSCPARDTPDGRRGQDTPAGCGDRAAPAPLPHQRKSRLRVTQSDFFERKSCRVKWVSPFHARIARRCSKRETGREKREKKPSPPVPGAGAAPRAPRDSKGVRNTRRGQENKSMGWGHSERSREINPWDGDTQRWAGK